MEHPGRRIEKRFMEPLGVNASELARALGVNRSTVSRILAGREELAQLVAIGHTDIMSVPPGFPSLANELASAGALPVISLPGLVLMKLDAFRPGDREDVRTLMLARPPRPRLTELPVGRVLLQLHEGGVE